MKKKLLGILYYSSRFLVVAWFSRLLIKILKNKAPVQLYILSSLSYREHGVYGLSLDISVKGLRHHSNHPRLLQEAGENYLQLGHYKRASKMFLQIISVDTVASKPRVWQKLSRAYRLDNKEYAAELVIDRAIDIFNYTPELIQEAIIVKSEIHDWQSVISLIEKKKDLLSLQNEDTVLLLRSLRLSHQYEKINKLIEKLDEKERNNFDILLELAEFETESSNWSDALGMWEKLLSNKNKKMALSTERHILLNISYIKRIIDIDSYRTKINSYKKRNQNKKLKIAIYTSYTEGYDQIKPHEYIDPRFDYFVFTDDNIKGFGLYKVDCMPTNHKDGRVAIRYPKTHPHVLFKDYDVAVWLDTSIMLVDDIYPIIEKFVASGKAIGTTPHTVRSSLFEEFVACIDLKKDNHEIIKKQYDFYLAEGFQDTVQSENGFLLFNIKNKSLKPALETWWEQILKYSKRDQLSFSYSLKKNSVEWYRISEPPNNINNNPAFLIAPHKDKYRSLDKLLEIIDK